MCIRDSLQRRLQRAPRLPARALVPPLRPTKASKLRGVPAADDAAFGQVARSGAHLRHGSKAARECSRQVWPHHLAASKLHVLHRRSEQYAGVEGPTWKPMRLRPRGQLVASLAFRSSEPPLTARSHASGCPTGSTQALHRLYTGSGQPQPIRRLQCCGLRWPATRALSLTLRVGCSSHAPPTRPLEKAGPTASESVPGEFMRSWR